MKAWVGWFLWSLLLAALLTAVIIFAFLIASWKPGETPRTLPAVDQSAHGTADASTSALPPATILSDCVPPEAQLTLARVVDTPFYRSLLRYRYQTDFDTLPVWKHSAVTAEPTVRSCEQKWTHDRFAWWVWVHQQFCHRTSSVPVSTLWWLDSRANDTSSVVQAERERLCLADAWLAWHYLLPDAASNVLEWLSDTLKSYQPPSVPDQRHHVSFFLPPNDQVLHQEPSPPGTSPLWLSDLQNRYCDWKEAMVRTTHVAWPHKGQPELTPRPTDPRALSASGVASALRVAASFTDEHFRSPDSHHERFRMLLSQDDCLEPYDQEVRLSELYSAMEVQPEHYYEQQTAADHDSGSVSDSASHYQYPTELKACAWLKQHRCYELWRDIHATCFLGPRNHPYTQLVQVIRQSMGLHDA